MMLLPKPTDTMLAPDPSPGTDTPQLPSMIAQAPSGETSTVPAPTMTAAGPLMQPPKPSDVTPSIPTPSGDPSAAQPWMTAGGWLPGDTRTSGPPGAPAGGAPATSSRPPSDATAGQGIHEAGSVATAPAIPAAPPAVPVTPPPGTQPGSSATAGSAAVLQMAAPTPAQIGAPAAQAPAGAPISATTGTGSGAVTRTALTGDETPYTIQPGMSSGLSDLLAKAQAAVGRGLDQPTAWDDELAQKIKDQQKRGIDANYTAEGDALDAELAGRGLNWSNIAGNRVVDLKTRKANALSDVDTNIARERVNALAAGRAGALASAQGILGQTSNIETGIQDAARGERNYTDSVRTQAHDQALQDTLAAHGMTMQDNQAWQDAINSGLAYGTGTAGTAALGQAAATNNAAGAQYGANAAASNEGLSKLMQLVMQFYGGK